jgi:aspartate racemase
MSEKTPGIIGGVGPEATVDLIECVVDRTPADGDQDHIRLLVEHDPKLPSRYDAIVGDGESPAPYLAEVAERLEAMGADFLVIASNLTHYFYEDAADAVDVPFLDLIEETVAHVASEYDVDRVGVLAPTPTIQVSLYQDELRAEGLTPVTLDVERNEELVDEAIYGERGIKAGHLDANRPPLETALGHLAEDGAEVTILGCTELPLVLGETEAAGDHSLVDATAVFADAIVERAKGGR